MSRRTSQRVFLLDQAGVGELVALEGLLQGLRAGLAPLGGQIGLADLHDWHKAVRLVTCPVALHAGQMV